jgi:hypothetical protein
VVERMRLRDPGALIDTVTVQDPDVLTRPWTINLLFHKQPLGTQIAEKVCDAERNKAAAAR